MCKRYSEVQIWMSPYYRGADKPPLGPEKFLVCTYGTLQSGSYSSGNNHEPCKGECNWLLRSGVIYARDHDVLIG